MEENRITPPSRKEENGSSKLNTEGTVPVRTEGPESGEPREDFAERHPAPDAVQNRGRTGRETSFETGTVKPVEGNPEEPGERPKEYPEEPGERPKEYPEEPGERAKENPDDSRKPGGKSGDNDSGDRVSAAAPAGNGFSENASAPESSAGGSLPGPGDKQKDSSLPEPGNTQKEGGPSASGKMREESDLPSSGERQKEGSRPDTGNAQREKEVENTLAVVRSSPPKKKGRRTATYREKILRHKRRQYRRTVFLVLLLMFLLTGSVFLWMYRGYTSAELRRIAALSAEDGADYANLNGNVVQYGGNGAICIDPRGNTLWTVSYEMQQPIVSVSGNVIAIANRSGYYIYVMNADGLMGTIHTMLPIQNIAAAENGEVAVVMSDSRTTWVRLYTAKGREIAYLVRTMEENGYPIAAAISPDGGTLCLSSVQISNAAVKTNVSFYNFGRAGKRANDHLVDYSDFIDETIPYLRYLDDSTCVGVSDKRLILFRSTFLHSSGSTNILLSENVQGVFSSENFTGLLFTNTSGNSQYRLDLYNRRGKKTGSVSFTMQFNNISIAGDKVYINNEHQCQIFTLGGRCLFNGEFSSSIRALIPGASLNDLLVVTAGEVDSVRLH